jgi:hypothetical protein
MTSVTPPRYEPKFRAGQRADGLLLEAQGLRFLGLEGANVLVGGLATVYDLSHGYLLWLMLPDDRTAVSESRHCGLY